MRRPTYRPISWRSSPPLPPNADARNVWKLDLAEALQVAIHRTPASSSSARPSGRELGIDVAKGAFEPVVTRPSITQHRSPPTSIQAAWPGEIITTTNEDWQLSRREHLATGAQARSSS